jgi:hypothetical protein
MAYKLKKEYESFTVVDGSFAGQTFSHATEYETIPPEEKGKFEKANKAEGGDPAKTDRPRSAKGITPRSGGAGEDGGQNNR